MFQPFQLTLWLLSFATIFVVSILFRIILLFYNLQTNARKTTDKTASIFYVIRMYSQGGISSLLAFKLTSLRLLLCSWLIGSLIFATYYSAGMNSILRQPRYEKSTKSLEDMAQRKMPWAFHYDYMLYYPRVSQESEVTKALKKLYKGKVVKNRTETAALPIRVVDRYAQKFDRLVSEENYLKYKVLRDCFDKFYRVFALNRNSPFTLLFDRVSRNYQTYGITAYWLNMAAVTNQRMQDSFLSEYEGDVERIIINMASLQGAFYLLLVGYAVSAAVFVFEKLGYGQA